MHTKSQRVHAQDDRWYDVLLQSRVLSEHPLHQNPHLSDQHGPQSSYVSRKQTKILTVPHEISFDKSWGTNVEPLMGAGVMNCESMLGFQMAPTT